MYTVNTAAVRNKVLLLEKTLDHPRPPILIMVILPRSNMTNIKICTIHILCFIAYIQHILPYSYHISFVASFAERNFISVSCSGLHNAKQRSVQSRIIMHQTISGVGGLHGNQVALALCTLALNVQILLPLIRY